MPCPPNLMPWVCFLVPQPPNLVLCPPNLVPRVCFLVPRPSNLVSCLPNLVPRVCFLVPRPPNLVSCPPNLVPHLPNYTIYGIGCTICTLYLAVKRNGIMPMYIELGCRRACSSLCCFKTGCNPGK